MTPRTLPRGLVAVLVLLGLVVAANIGIWLLDNATRGADRVGDDSDPTSTAPNGTAAWVELLRADGAEVELVDALPTRVDPSTTIVVLERDPTAADVESLGELASSGGRIVVGGRTGEALLATVLRDPPAWSPVGTERAVAVGTAPETERIRAVAAAGEGSWGTVGSTTPLLDGAGTVIASRAGTTGGTIVALADPSVVQNRLLGEEDNAAFALNIVDDRRVTLVDGRGASTTTGIAAIPDRWKLALAGLVVAFLVGAVAIGRRIGPPDETGRERPPPRRTYVDAVGLALERTHRPAEALLGLQRHARAGLVQRAGLHAEATDEELRTAAGRLGWPSDEIEAVLTPATSATMLAAGRALARVTATEAPRARANEGAGA